MNAAKTAVKVSAKKTAKKKTAAKPASGNNLVEAAKQLGKLEVVVVGDRKPVEAPKALPGKPAATVKITILSRECPHAEGTHRAESWSALLDSKDSAEYAAKGGAHKYLTRWAAKGLITLG